MRILYTWYIHMYMYTYVYTYIHTYTHTWVHTRYATLMTHKYTQSFQTHWHIHTCVCTAGHYEDNARLYSLAHTHTHTHTHSLTHSLSHTHICSRRGTQCTFDLLAPIPCIYTPLLPLVKIVSTLSKASNVGHCNDVVSCYQVRIVSGFRTR